MAPAAGFSRHRRRLAQPAWGQGLAHNSFWWRLTHLAERGQRRVGGYPSKPVARAALKVVALGPVGLGWGGIHVQDTAKRVVLGQPRARSPTGLNSLLTKPTLSRKRAAPG